MNKWNILVKELHSFFILWITQSLSALGSAMTNFALIIWSYQEQGSALSTALLSVCSYAPYVIMSIFAGALSDRWNKKIAMLVSDSMAAFCTVIVLLLLSTERLQIWHLYVLNGVNGLMNTIQQPAADVTITLLTPSKHFQRVSGLRYLKENRGILDLILFLAAINLIASIYDAALPAMVLSRADSTALGAVNLVIGIATLIGSLLASAAPEPKSRVRIICNTLLISMSTENFVLALTNSVPLWCIGGFLGWIGIPLMSANMDVLFRKRIPVTMQGRVYSARNTLQFFTIPVGYLLGGALVDKVFEPLMGRQNAESVLISLFGSGKGSGAQVLFFLIGIAGVLVCLFFRRDTHIWALEDRKE